MDLKLSFYFLCLVSLSSARNWKGIDSSLIKLQVIAQSPGGNNDAILPIQPAQFPPIDQTPMITGALLEDPLVTQALAKVNSIVPANLLAIPPSTYVKDSTVKYNSDAAANCYWPNGLCIRQQDGVGYVKDVYTCLGQNQWGLSYDDGPTSTSTHTDDSVGISNQLTSMGIHGTFFVTGSRVTENPDTLKLLDAAGHQIASHTWTHHPLTSLTNAQIVAEVKYTEAIIFKNIGKVPTYLRPPYGDIDDRVRAIVNALGYKLVLWQLDSTDASLTENAANEQKSLSIITSWFTGQQTSFVSLEHDISPFTSRIAIAALKAMDVARKSGAFKWNLMDIASCNNDKPYTIGGNSTANATTTTLARTATVTVSSPTVTVGSVQIGNGKQVASEGNFASKVDLKMVVGSGIMNRVIANLEKRAIADVYPRGPIGESTIPVQPAQYPPIDQTLMISGALLQEPIVTEALAKITATVPASLLEVPPSVYIKQSNVTYKSDPVKNCYWPNGLCIRKQDGVGFAKDVYTCLGQNQWGLSYDDGPTFTAGVTEHTDDSVAISNQLTAMGLHATFFVTGSRVTENPDTLKFLDAAGHQIASHTWTHHPLTSLTNAQIVAEVKYTEAIIYKNIGKVPAFLRPPYGDIDDRVRAIVNALGYKLVLWQVDSEDASLTESAANEQKALNTITSWFTGQQGSFISLEHDISKFTSRIAVAALKAMDVARKSGNFKWSLMDVATCNNENPYTIPGNSTVATTVTTAVRATTTAAFTTVEVTVVTPTITGAVKIGSGKQVESGANKGQKLSFLGVAAGLLMLSLLL
ncbi:chitin deacetylase [Nowakowskiella sp. JEL0407]|nr:chitin deacetylase [Nowakowskiella sp. JEL0407]